MVNFDLARTRERDIERHFEPYGRIKRVEIKKVGCKPAWALVGFRVCPGRAPVHVQVKKVKMGAYVTAMLLVW